MGTADITPRHEIRNMDGNKCGYYVLEFNQMLIEFGTYILNLDRNYIRNYTREMNDKVMDELSQWLDNFLHGQSLIKVKNTVADKIN